MSKILVIEENKSLGNMIEERILSQFDFEVILLNSLEEFRIYITKLSNTIQNLNEDILVALVSDKLIDSYNSSSVTEVAAYGIPVIAMSSEKNKIFNNVNVVIEIYKENVNDILYAISFIGRLEQNKFNSVLVVGDSKIYRKKIANELKKQLFNVVESNDGKEALLKITESVDNQFKLVITDCLMDEISGLELTYFLRKKYSKEELGIIAIPSIFEKNKISEFLKSGANDIIDIDFTREEFISRINNTMIYIENINNMKEVAYKDYLTGLFNRRYFYQKMEGFLNTKEYKPFALAMIDIDYFKKLNDNYGHDFGDLVLKKFSNLILSNVKYSDIVSRFGGEEFVIVLKNINLENSIVFFEKLLKEVNEIDFEYNKKVFHITVSIGVVFIDDENNLNKLDDIIKEADNKLYLAKDSGRNKVIY